MEPLILIAAVVGLVIFDILAVRFGGESREAFTDPRHCPRPLG